MKKINILYFIFLLLLELPIGLLQAQTVGIRLPDTTSVQGAFLDMPLYAESTPTDREVYSYSFQLRYDPYYFQPVSVVTSETISQAFGTPTINTSVSGIITLAAAGTVPVSGSGKFIVFRWKVLRPGWTTISFTDAAHNYLNEGTPPLTFKSGNVSIVSAPKITVYPDQNIIAKGEQLQLNVSEGTGPYAWSVTDNNLAEIDQNGLLTAKAVGNVKVVAVDVLGVRDTTSNIEIRPVRLSVPTNLTQWEGLYIDVPVQTSDLTGLDITSGSFQLGFSSNMLQPVSVIQTGTILESGSVFMQRSNAQVSIAFTGTTALTGSGTLLYVRFNVLNNSETSSNLEIRKILFNESLLATNTNGYFTRKTFSWRYIYPDAGTLIVDETLVLNVGGEAIKPLKWSVSDTTLAKINQSGVLTACKRGNVKVTVIDSVGAPAYTNTFAIFDTKVVTPDTSICRFGQVVEYPVYLQSVPKSDSILSLQAEMNYDADRLSFAGINTVGTAIQSWISAIHETSGNISLAASGSAFIHKSGVLVKLRFLPKSGFTYGSWAGVMLNKLTFNEGSPTTLIDTYGYIAGDSPDIVSTQILVMPSPMICKGDTVVFDSHVTNGGIPRYQWLRNGLELRGRNADTLRISTLQASDTISCRVISTDPCAIDSVSYSNKVVMTVNERPAAAKVITGDAAVSRGASNLVYSITEIPNTTFYIWNLPLGFMGMSTTNIITVQVAPNAPPSGTISVYGVNSCGKGDAASLNVTVSIHVRLSTLFSHNIKLFPNPVDDVLHIALNNVSNSEAVIQVYDAIGRLIKINQVNNPNEIILNFRNQDPGIYLVKVSYENEPNLYKIVKK
jgi:hypothetical protein